MNTNVKYDNFNYKLKRLIYFWQDNFGKNCYQLPTHREFFDMCSIVFNKSHQDHIDMFEEYLLTGIDNGYFPDKFSSSVKEFFYPIIALWREISEVIDKKLPTCEDIIILAEAIACCSDSTNQIVFSSYGLTDLNYSVTSSQRTWIRKPQMRLMPEEKSQLQIQYKLAKKRWKKIPIWVSLSVKWYYPYR